MKFESYRISELIEEIAMGPFGSNIKVECFVDNGIPVLNGSNLDGIILKDGSFRYITEEKAESLKRANAHRGDIVITHRGTLGQIVYIPRNSKYDRYVISQSQFRIRCNEKVLPEYLVYYFHTPIGQAKLLSNASQVGVPALARPSTTFQQIEVELPSLSIQKRIIDILRSLDDKIELNNKISENLERQAQAIFRSWFLDYLPFNSIKPTHWKFCTLGETTKMSAGGDKPKGISNIKSTEYPYPIYSNGLDNEGLYGYTNEAKIFAESVTVSARGTIGFVCLRHIPYVPIVRLVTLIPNENLISAKYLYLYLKQLRISGTGTTQQQLTVPDFRKTEILIPDKITMDKFTNLISPMFNQIWANGEENIKLASLRDSLLPKLMSGEIEL